MSFSRVICVSICFLFLLTGVRLEADVVSPKAKDAKLKEARIRTFGHMRMCLVGGKKTSQAYKALDFILKKCPDFFLTENRPIVFARALSGEKSRRSWARRLLAKHKLDDKLKDKEFCQAVLLYVNEKKMMKKAKILWQQADRVITSLREVSEYHTCAQVNEFLVEAVKKARKRGVKVLGKLDKEKLSQLKRELPNGIGCPKTLKASDLSVSSQGKVTCSNHGTLSEASAFKSPFSKAALKMYLEHNPFLWAVDHSIRLEAAQRAVAKIDKH